MLTTGELIRKISGLNGDIKLCEALTINTKGAKLVDVIEENEDEEDVIVADDTDGEEIKKIAGKGLNTRLLESDDLILHLVSTSLNNIHERY